MMVQNRDAPHDRFWNVWRLATVSVVSPLPVLVRAMSEMITRLARSIAGRKFAVSLRRDEGPDDARTAERFESYYSSQRGFFEAEARANIEVMREPSKAMMDAGRPWAFNDRLPPNCWVKMIDAALKEGE